MTKVMVVEDDLSMQGLLQTLLSMEGYQVILGSNGCDEIIAAIYQEKPDILLLDVYLKKMSGLEILRRLHTVPGSFLPHVLMSSGRDVSDECLKAGADGFLLKPYMPSELTGWIKDHIEQKRG